jgi:hypothetical protein
VFTDSLLRVGIFGDYLIGLHVLPHQLTGNHYRDLLHDLPKLLGDVPLAEHECGTCIIMIRHILAALCEMFSITPIVTDGWVREDPLHDLHPRQISSSGFLHVGTSKNPCVCSSC